MQDAYDLGENVYLKQSSTGINLLDGLSNTSLSDNVAIKLREVLNNLNLTWSPQKGMIVTSRADNLEYVIVNCFADRGERYFVLRLNNESSELFSCYHEDEIVQLYKMQ